jgi:hypothetical protein
MENVSDPRLKYFFEPGTGAAGVIKGLDQSLTTAVQSDQANKGQIAIYNRSTFSRNQYLPGILFSATEANLLLAEYYLKRGNATSAKDKFETAVKESIKLYQSIRAKSNDNTVAAPKAPTTDEINAFLTKINFAGTTNKLELIANQKWIHFNVLQTVQAWSEVRRLDFPKFTYVIQNSDIQKTVPVKFPLPPSESVYNTENHNAVKDQDNANTKLFWDIN